MGALADGSEHDELADFGSALLPGLRAFRPGGLFVADGGSECRVGPCCDAGSARSCGRRLSRWLTRFARWRVVFEIASIDRMYCNVFIPGLQYAAGLVGYVHQQLGLPIASTAPLAKISDRPVTRVPSPRAS